MMEAKFYQKLVRSNTSTDGDDHVHDHGHNHAFDLHIRKAEKRLKAWFWHR